MRVYNPPTTDAHTQQESPVQKVIELLQKRLEGQAHLVWWAFLFVALRHGFWPPLPNTRPTYYPVHSR
jgi:hypothetical protein